MARRPNYSGEKRQKEMMRQKKKEAKLEKKRMKKEEAASGELTNEVDGGGMVPETEANRDGGV